MTPPSVDISILCPCPIVQLSLVVEQHLVSAGRDFSCSVWSGSQLAMGLNWLETMPQIAEKSYRYMACR